MSDYEDVARGFVDTWNGFTSNGVEMDEALNGLVYFLALLVNEKPSPGAAAIELFTCVLNACKREGGDHADWEHLLN